MIKLNPAGQGARTLGAALCCVVLAGCAAQPGPAPLVAEVTTTVSATSTSTKAAVPAEQQPTSAADLVIGVEQLPESFNPYLPAYRSAVSQQVAALTLPMPFLGGQPNPDVVVSAELDQPAAGAAQSVTYELNHNAQWSDGTPITGADFEYLATVLAQTDGAEYQQLYQQIQAVRTTGSGKTVTVDFAVPVANWAELFPFLLPSHVLRALNTSFLAVLADAATASGGKFAVKSIDRSRGIVTLQRNDRFWGPKPAQVDSVEFRASRDVAGQIEMLRSGQTQIADLALQQTTEEELSLLPGVQLREYVRDAQLTVAVNPRSEQLAEQAARLELFAVLNQEQLARLGAGRTSGVAMVPRPAFAPPPAQSVLVPAAARVPLLVAVAHQADAASRAVASAVINQLGAAGIKAALTTDYGAADVRIGWQNTHTDALASAARLLCTAAEQPACQPPLSTQLWDVVASGDQQAAAEITAQVNATQGWQLPLFYETRLLAATTSLSAVTGGVGLAQQPVDVAYGLALTVPSWQQKPAATATSTAPTTSSSS